MLNALNEISYSWCTSVPKKLTAFLGKATPWEGRDARGITVDSQQLTRIVIEGPRARRGKGIMGSPKHQIGDLELRAKKDSRVGPQWYPVVM